MPHRRILAGLLCGLLLNLLATTLFAADRPPNDRKPVKLSSVNREFATMRHLLKNALAEGWITKDVFAGSKVIDKDAEAARTRTLWPMSRGRASTCS